MTYTREINVLRAYCRAEAGRCHEAEDSLCGIALWELGDALCTLTDRPFSSPAHFRDAVCNLPCLRDGFTRFKPRNKVEAYKLKKLAGAFREQIDLVLSGGCGLTPLPYRRIIGGDEAAGIEERYQAFWSFDGHPWFPLNSVPPPEIADRTMYLMFEYVEPYMDRLAALMGMTEHPIYRWVETFGHDAWEQTAELEPYTGLESVYFDESFTWMVYFTHESTVEFAGSIVESVKELLAGEQAHFNCFELE